jgi:sodium/proline symporter
MLAALLIAPIFALLLIRSGDVETAAVFPERYWSFTGKWTDIASGLGWGLGYFGMPHIIIRFMSLESQKSLKKSAGIGIGWTVLILIFAVIVGIIGREFLGFDEEINANSLVFITMVRKIFPGVISGILLSAILAASMSTADSQLLAAASAFASDVYKPIIRKDQASDKEMLWAGRYVVLLIAVIAVVIAANPNAGSIMSLVSNAWGVFGAAFGPVIMLSLFWKRFTFSGAVTGIVVGAAVDILWLAFLSSTGVYEIIPGAVCGLVAAVVVSLCSKAPEKDVEELYDRALTYTED